MNTVIKYIKMDWKGVLCNRNLVVTGLIAIVVLIFVQSGVYKYKTLQKDKKEFQEIERLKVESYKRVEEFGIIGLKLILIPEPTIVFFINSAVNFELISHINSADVLDMDQSSLGKKLFSDRKGGFKDFSGIIFLLVSLAVLYLGINSIGYPEFRKFLSSVSGPVKIYLLLIFSRTLLIVLFLALITVCSVGLVLLNRIPLPSRFYSHLSGFFFLMAGVIIFFYALGTFLGTLPKRVSSILLGIGLWFVLIFLVPEGINYIVEKQADRINSNFKYELDKIRHEMGFEVRGKKKLDKYSTPKTRKKLIRELVDSYLLREAKLIEKLEQEREEAMRNLLETRKMLSSFFPSSFYLATSHSVSSGGYESSVDFYRFTYQLKNLLFLLFSGKIKKLRKMGYTGMITMDNVDVSKTGYSDKFLYICRPADVPGDIRTGDWLSLTAALMKLPAEKTRDFIQRPEIQPHPGKKFKELTDLQKSEILLSLIDLGNYRVYLVNDTAAGLSRDFFLRLNDRLEELAQTGPVVIYLSSVYIPVKEKENIGGEKPFFPDTSWPHDIAFIKRSNKVKSGE